MGGLLIGEILKADPEVFQNADRILLQPKSSIPELREALYHMGYSVLEEVLVPEEEKLYHILSVEKTPEQELFSYTDFVLGRQLCQSKPEHFDRYLTLQRERLSRKLSGLKQGKSANKTSLEETKALLDEIEVMQK